MTPAEMLECAAVLIEHDGLWKPTGGAGYCPITAMCEIAGATKVLDLGLLDHAQAILAERLPRPELSVDRRIALWNDDPARTKEEVVREMRAAAKDAEHVD